MNENLNSLKEAAIEAVREFKRLYAIPTNGSDAHAREIARAAATSVTMQKAYAIMLGIGYDMAAEIIHEEAKKEIQ